MEEKNNIAIFGGGCFWCTEAIFSELKGVVSVMPGYCGGHKENPTYEEVSSGTTGHAEAVRIVFDPTIIFYTDLLEIFFALHDPTTKNQQGNDYGEQYRSIIFYVGEEQRIAVKNFIQNIEKEYANPIVTELLPFDAFYNAEDYHKNYYAMNPDKPYCYVVISPKLQKLRQKFSKFLKP